MSTGTKYLSLAGFSYLFYRYWQARDDADFDLLADLSSTLSTGADVLNPSTISFPCVDPETGRDYAEAIHTACATRAVPPLLLAALIKQESGFRASVRNSASGAMGLGQFMPATALEYFGADWAVAVYKPDRAIPCTARYLAWLYRRHGTWRLAVAAYNWGTGNLATKGLANAPTETRDYVRRVYDAYSANLPA